jgi:hypothetical protein
MEWDGIETEQILHTIRILEKVRLSLIKFLECGIQV